MSTFYYLISTLPSLTLWEKPEINLESFLTVCSELLDEKEMQILDEVDTLPVVNPLHKNKTIDKWYKWETCLRNRIARSRSSSIDADCTPYLQEEKDYFPETDRIVQEAFGADTPLHKEKILDEGRWNRLIELESGHIFDIELVCIYKLKLLLSKKWDNRTEEKGKENLETALTELYKEDFLKID